MLEGLETTNYSLRQNKHNNNFAELYSKEEYLSIRICIDNLDEIIELIQNYQKIVLKQKPKYPFMECTDKWINKRGEELELESMTTKHLYNCKAMIESICRDEELRAKDYSIYNCIERELYIRQGDNIH